MRGLCLAGEEHRIGNEMDSIQNLDWPFDEPSGQLHQFSDSANESK